MTKIIFILTLCLSPLGFAQDVAVKPRPIKSFDGFPLETLIESPTGISKKAVKKVIILLHGSGAQSYDEDLSEVTLPAGTKNYFFRDLAEVFLKNEIAVIRYNKRSYEFKKRATASPEFKTSREAKKFLEHPYEYLLKDAQHFVHLASTEFPNAKVLLLGHSEGTGVALQVARREKAVKGVALIGFSNEPITSNLLEQFVYRPRPLFDQLDKNKNIILESEELKINSDLARSFDQQMATIDLDKDGKLSLSEFQAAQYSNLILQDDFYNQNYMNDFFKLPRLATVIKEAAFSVWFFHGEYDNQTQVYQTEAIDLINRSVWKKENLKFIYFPRAGHALDPRDNLSDLTYSLTPKENIEILAKEL